jgi:hypothetical protein
LLLRHIEQRVVFIQDRVSCNYQLRLERFLVHVACVVALIVWNNFEGRLLVRLGGRVLGSGPESCDGLMLRLLVLS